MPEAPHIVHDVVEEVKSLEHEAEEGASARTPLILVSGVAVFLSIVVGILLVAAFLAYYLTK
jgi:hypothetical protein